MGENNLEFTDIEFESSLCIICYKRCESKKASVRGINGLRRSNEARKKKYDKYFELAIHRIDLHFRNEDNVQPEIRYHANCYATFTSSTHISRLPDRVLDSDPQTNTNVDFNGNSNSNHLANTNLDINDNAQSGTDWAKCIFCQEDKKERLKEVRTDGMATTIKNLGIVSDQLSIRILSGTADLKQCGTSYHTNCLNKHERLLNKLTASNDNNNNQGFAFTKLISELRIAAAQGKVLKLADVYAKFLKLADEFGEPVPPSFESRRSTFKEKLVKELHDVYQFYQPLDRDIHERKMLLIPINFQNKIIADRILNEEEEEHAIPSFVPEVDDIDRSIIYSGLKIHNDLKNTPGHKGFNVSLESAMAIVPEKLYMLLTIVCDGLKGLENLLDDGETEEEIDAETDDSDDDTDDTIGVDDAKEGVSSLKTKIISIAQDIVYVASRGKKLTPKHIGLSLSLNRSKKLVTLFNKAGHCLTYRQVLQVDAALADQTLDSLDYSTGAVKPPNILPYQTNTLEINCPILHVTADNIDKQTDTLDGKNSFHATQMVVFQRGGDPIDRILNSLKVTQKLSFQVPEILGKVFDPVVPPQEEPVLNKSADLKWYGHNCEKQSDCVMKAEAKDLAFLIGRQFESNENKIGWTEHNKIITTKNPSMTSYGFMPLILNPAHEYNTLHTVLMRCVSLADNLNYPYIDLVVDQALFCKLLELRWSSEIFQNRIILRMGGLHLSMNFLGAIGQHMKYCGLSEIWIESGVLSVGSVAKVLEGKAYSKGMRVHKLTYQALWSILMPRFLNYLEKHLPSISKKLHDVSQNYNDLTEFFILEDHKKIVTEFLQQESETNPNLKFWIIYISMVSTLLKFTRSIRDGEWDLYLDALNEMSPLLARYDHFKYLASLTAYIYMMNNLPPEVLAAFKRGEFVVKRSNTKFNQVCLDHAQEWLVKTCKATGGISGITSKENSLQKWILSFHWRAEIVQKTFSMFSTESAVGEMCKGRLKRDQDDENAILNTLNDFNVLSVESSNVLQNLATKDVATEDIQKSLLGAIELGKKQVVDFVTGRMTFNEREKPAVSFVEKISKNMPLTFANLHKTTKAKPVQKRLAQNEVHLLQRLVMAYEAGRPVDLINALKHELQIVPLSLAEPDGSLRSGDDFSLLNVLSKGISSASSINFIRNTSHLILDAKTIITALGNPKKMQTFGDLADMFVQEIKTLAVRHKRVDIVFDQFNNKLIKQNDGHVNSVRRVIQNEKVPLPKNWKTFLSNYDNQRDLAKFVSTVISTQTFEDTDIVVSGAMENGDVFSSNKDIETEKLKTKHESVATRIALHAILSSATTIVISTPDANAAIMGIRHFDKIKCKEMWLETKSSKKKQYLPIHEIAASISKELRSNLLVYHALTGCESTSYLHGVTKSGSWDKYVEHFDLLTNFRLDVFTEARNLSENFMIKLYKVEQGVENADLARYVLFRKLKKLDKLPPTSDALELHMKRAYYQQSVWEFSPLGVANDLLPEEYGWKISECGNYVPILTLLEPVPDGFLDLISCGCEKTQCSRATCKCRKNSVGCTPLCGCNAPCHNVNA